MEAVDLNGASAASASKRHNVGCVDMRFGSSHGADQFHSDGVFLQRYRIELDPPNERSKQLAKLILVDVR